MSAVSLAAETEIQERSEHNHPWEEQEHKAVHKQSLNLVHPMPTGVHPGKQRQGNHHQIKTAEEAIGQEDEEGLLRNQADKGLEVQIRPTNELNLGCSGRGHGGIGRRTGLKRNFMPARE